MTQRITSFNGIHAKTSSRQSSGTADYEPLVGPPASPALHLVPCFGNVGAATPAKRATPETSTPRHPQPPRRIRHHTSLPREPGDHHKLIVFTEAVAKADRECGPPNRAINRRMLEIVRLRLLLIEEKDLKDFGDESNQNGPTSGEG
jgi:hypothetical protein